MNYELRKYGGLQNHSGRIPRTDIAGGTTITRETIQEIYPHYYPKGAVDFFLSHHNDTGIRQDLKAGSV